MKLLIAFFCCAFATLSMQAQDWKTKIENAAFLHRAMKQVTDVMVYDIYSPPVAARTYAYVSIAGYEAAVASNDNYISFKKQLREFAYPELHTPKDSISYTIAAVEAILGVGSKLVISENKLAQFRLTIMEEFKATGVPFTILENSVRHGQEITKQILAWAEKDNYKQTRTFARFTPTNDAATWKPTPPAYMKALEPHWSRIRPFLLDYAGQFKPTPPTLFSIDSASQFYKEALAVRDSGLKLTEEQKAIANFWDCNPFKMNVSGHVMYASKKISPGGHWINITRLACEKNNATSMQSLAAYATVAITISDAFISCWDEKYRSLVIRPETYINKYIDKSWMPLLQTPPFPEYTSGHSVISGAASVILSSLFGDSFSFIDSTEIEFGLPPRNFKSFTHAADEAAISRFYGGIHYMPAIVNGLDEGKKIGKFVLKNIRKNKSS